MRLLAVAQGELPHDALSAEQAHHYLAQVLALNLDLLFETGGEAIRVHEIEIEKRLDDLPLSKFKPDPWLGSEPLGHR